MKREFLLCLFLLLTKAVQCQVEFLPSQIFDNTYFNCDTLWVTDTVHVHEGAELHISGQTKVLFSGAFPIWINGRFTVTGDSADPVIFAPADTTGWHDIFSDSGGWPGIRLSGNNAGKKADISHARFLFAKNIGLNNGYGGAFFARNTSEINFSHVTFSHCMAMRGGAVYMRKVPIAVVTNSAFYYNNLTNSISTAGSAVHLADSVNSYWYKNHFEYNGREMVYIYDSTSGMWIGYATGSVFRSTAESGLPPSTHTSSHKIESNTFVNNYASASVINIFSRFIYIYNNLIVSNEGSGIDGGIYARGIIANNLLANHTGPPIYSNNEHLKYYGNIFWNNYGNNSSFADYQNAQYNISQFALPGIGNISEIPDFENPVWAYGIDPLVNEADWRLKENSPGIDAGPNDTTGLYLPEWDAWNNPRISGNRVDMGPFELPQPWKIDASILYPSVSVFPNPCRDILTLGFPISNESFSVRVFSASGATISLPFNNNQVDVSPLAPGNYTGLILKLNRPEAIFTFSVIR